MKVGDKCDFHNEPSKNEGYWVVSYEGCHEVAYHDGDDPDDYPLSFGNDTYDQDSVMAIQYLGKDLSKIMFVPVNSVSTEGEKK